MRQNLLSRQIKKFFGEEDKVPEGCREFINAVDDAYRQADSDRLMLERSLDLSSQEMLRANDEIVKTISLLSATFEATINGILVVDNEGKVERYNKKFLEMWRIPGELAEQKDDAKLLDFVTGQLSSPEAFLSKVKELYSNPDRESHDTINFKDGRVFERFSRPQKVGGKVIGRVWSFGDITELNKKITELEAFYKMAMGREDKILELKNEVKDLRAQLDKIKAGAA